LSSIASALAMLLGELRQGYPFKAAVGGDKVGFWCRTHARWGRCRSRRPGLVQALISAAPSRLDVSGQA